MSPPSAPSLIAMEPSPVALPERWLVQVCQHRTCQRHQSSKVLEAFKSYQSKRILVAQSDCMGQCSSGPTVRVMPDNTWYCRVQPEDVEQIVHQHLEGGERLKKRLHPRFHPQV